jgi:hypothetical protein
MLLEQLRSKGVEVRADGDRLNLRPASALSPEELAQAKALKPDIMRLLAPSPLPTPAHHLRVAIKQWFSMTVVEADGRRSDPAAVETLYQQIVKLIDEIGPAFAATLIHEEARRFRWETGRCGWCGLLEHAEDCRP